MKIAIPSSSKDPSAVADERFARAPVFAIYDTDSGRFEFVDNPAANAASGAGPMALKQLKSLGVDVLLACHVGPKVRDLLEAAGIEYHLVDPAPISDVVKRFLAER